MKDLANQAFQQQIEQHVNTYRRTGDPWDAVKAFCALKNMMEHNQEHLSYYERESGHERLQYTQIRIQTSVEAINELDNKKHLNDQERSYLETLAYGFAECAITRIERDLEAIRENQPVLAAAEARPRPRKLEVA